MLMRNHLQRIRAADQCEGNDLAEVIRNDRSDRTLNFLHGARTRVTSEVDVLS